MRNPWRLITPEPTPKGYEGTPYGQKHDMGCGALGALYQVVLDPKLSGTSTLAPTQGEARVTARARQIRQIHISSLPPFHGEVAAGWVEGGNAACKNSNAARFLCGPVIDEPADAMTSQKRASDKFGRQVVGK